MNKDSSALTLAGLACAMPSVGNYLSGLRGSPRRRDSLPQEEQLRRIAKAQQKRERKAKNDN